MEGYASGSRIRVEGLVCVCVGGYDFGFGFRVQCVIETGLRLLKKVASVENVALIEKESL